MGLASNGDKPPDEDKPPNGNQLASDQPHNNNVLASRAKCLLGVLLTVSLFILAAASQTAALMSFVPMKSTCSIWRNPIASIIMDIPQDGCDVVLYRPGNVLSATSSVKVNGIESFQPSGDVWFTTVTIQSDVSVLDWMWISALSTSGSNQNNKIEKVPRRLVFGDMTQQETRSLNSAMMASSRDIATLTALEYIGVEILAASGVSFVRLTQQSPAQGILSPDDIIVAIDGELTTSVDKLVAVIRKRKPGDVVTLQVHNSSTGEREERNITLGTHPEPDANYGFVGIIGLYDNFDIMPMDFGIEITTGEIGGPSAGVAFTIAILDVLTPGELTGGLNIAATGTISLDGQVGNVGGARQKTVAAAKSGADVFIVPNALLPEVLDVAGAMPVEGVDTLEDVLEVLSEYGGDLAGIENFTSLTS